MSAAELYGPMLFALGVLFLLVSLILATLAALCTLRAP